MKKTLLKKSDLQKIVYMITIFSYFISENTENYYQTSIEERVKNIHNITFLLLLTKVGNIFYVKQLYFLYFLTPRVS